MKNKKKIWIVISVVVLVLLGCVGIGVYHQQNNIAGVWKGDTETDVMQINKNGTGKYWDYADDSNYNLSWHKNGGKYHFEYQDGDEDTMFTGYLKNGKLVTKDGTNWSAETYVKSHKDIDTVRTQAQKRSEATPQTLANQGEERIWVVLDYNENSKNLFDTGKKSNTIEQIIETKAGKGRSFYLDPFANCKFKDIAGKSNSEIISYAKKNAWNFNGGKDAEINGISEWSNLKFGQDEYKSSEEAFKYGKDMEISLKASNYLDSTAAGYAWFGWKTDSDDFLVTRDSNENYNPNVHLDELSNTIDCSDGQCDNSRDVEGEILGVMGALKFDQADFLKNLNNNNVYYTGTDYYSDTSCDDGKLIYGNKASDNYLEFSYDYDYPLADSNSKLKIKKYIDPDHLTDEPKGVKFNVQDLTNQYYNNSQGKQQLENYISKIHKISDKDLQKNEGITDD